MPHKVLWFVFWLLAKHYIRVSCRRRRMRMKRLHRRRQQQQLSNLLTIQVSLLKIVKKLSLRSHEMWTKTGIIDWWQNVLTNEQDSYWLENFRVTKSAFHKLVDILRPHLEPAKFILCETVPLEKRVALCLYKLASCVEYKVVGKQFGVHESTMRKMLHSFCTVLAKVSGQFIKMPNAQEAEDISRRIEAKHFIPQLFGSVDGCHIPVQPPEIGFRDFINRKGWTSYVVQAVIDDKYLFRNVSCRVPGSAHDATVLKESRLFSESETIIPKSSRVINGKAVPLMLVGDPSYPLLPWLITAFTSSNLSEKQETFNFHLNWANSSDTAFGILKARWRVLCKKMDDYKFAPKVVAACCVLHNFCEINKCSFNNQWMRHHEVLTGTLLYPQPQSHYSTHWNGDAKIVRDTLVEHNLLLVKKT